MKPTAIRLFAIFTLAGAFTASLISPAQAGVQDFSFSSLDADYTLSRDAQRVGHLHVVEHLHAVFPDFDQNHGIIRAIPQSYEGHSVHLKVSNVTDDSGAAIPFTKSSANHNLELKIGRAEEYVHGRQTYVITYDQDNVTAKADGYEGLFWDVNGDQWSQTFDSVSARIHIDPALLSSRDVVHDRCFTGTRGSRADDCTIEGEDNPAIVRTLGPLQAGQTLTYELGFKPGTFAAYTIPTSEILAWAAKIFFFLVLPIGLTLWFALRRWWRYGRDPAGRGIVIAEYTPPKDISVLTASAVLHEGFRTSALTATILDLAVRRYLKVYEVMKKVPLLPDKRTYEIELVRNGDDLKDEERQVMTMLFKGSTTVGAWVSLDSLKNQLYQEAADLGTAVNKAATENGYFATNPDSIKVKYYAIGAVLIFLGLAFNAVALLLAIGLAASGLIVIVVAGAMPARTAKGVEVRDILLGLKEFITVAESQRIQAMQSPRGDLTEKIDVGDSTQLVKVYERLLPYAMLFGVEEAWIKEFAGLYAESPDWYQGNGAFNAAYFAGSVSNFSTASAAGFTAPASSSGGGSAGGGGGGGGGGGW